jgi:hypothetical protein
MQTLCGQAAEGGMTEACFSGTVKGGRLPKPVSESIAKLLARMEGKTLEISIREVKRPRSLKQNKFYQGLFINAFADCLMSCGQRVDPEDIHAGLRDAYAKNSYAIIMPDGKQFRVPPSTRRLTTTGFENYLEEIRAEYATKFGWQLPFPGEYQP